jgi:hypothetical protein
MLTAVLAFCLPILQITPLLRSISAPPYLFSTDTAPSYLQTHSPGSLPPGQYRGRLMCGSPLSSAQPKLRHTYSQQILRQATFRHIHQAHSLLDSTEVGCCVDPPLLRSTSALPYLFSTDTAPSYLQTHSPGSLPPGQYRGRLLCGSPLSSAQPQLRHTYSPDTVLRRATFRHIHQAHSLQDITEVGCCVDHPSPPLNLSSAILILNRYCAKLPSDTFTRLTPFWTVQR